jgi:hypothetical protein
MLVQAGALRAAPRRATPLHYAAMRRSGCARGLALCLLVLCGADARAQAPKADEATFALGYLVGRYRMPVTCTLASGEIVEREEAVVFRPGPARSGRETVRATFFGIDAPGAVRCYNLVSARVPDRRGVVILGWEGFGRTDLGMRDFKQELKRGSISYPVVGGELTIRDPEHPGVTQVTRPDRDGSRFVVAAVRPESDGEKLLSRVTPGPRRGAPRPPRKFEFTFTGVEGMDRLGYYLEDLERAR